MTTTTIKINKLLQLLFANISQRKFRHNDVTIMLIWHQMSVENFKKKHFLLNPNNKLKNLNVSALNFM